MCSQLTVGTQSSLLNSLRCSSFLAKGMKICTFAALIVAVAVMVVGLLPRSLAHPAGLDARPDTLPESPNVEGRAERHTRATCDLLSFSSKWVTPNHSACAAHCLVKGFKGGRCVDTICRCRK